MKLSSLFLSTLLLLGSCAARQEAFDFPPQATQLRVEQLRRDISQLSGDIDGDEARRAASIALEYSQVLAEKYRITGSAIYHNLLVNLGVRERGLCIDWTADLMARLQQEKFRSIQLHWAIANYQASFRLEHSSVVLSAQGESIEQGLLLDPWRFSGDLYWARTGSDPGYHWRPRAEVIALKRSFEAELENRMTR